MSPDNLAGYAEALERLGPRAVYGYPTAIYLMALWLREQGNDRIRPAAVFTASETLLPHYREVIEAAFGCPVLDWYGATEFIANITQCEQGSYHIKHEYGVVELVDETGRPVPADEPGLLVGTGLNNHAMPLFRYQVGDLAVAGRGSCPCGRAGRLIESIVGRTEDVVVTPEGRYITRLDFIFKAIDTVREAQLVQERVDELRVRVVAEPGFGSGDEAAIVRALQGRLGDRMDIRVERVAAIPRLPSGKFRYVISKVPLDLAGARQTGEVLGLSDEEDATL
jgi:phenylacetate-CoA ligase